MAAQTGHDEFEERTRLAAEAQKIGDEYVAGLRRVAVDAFLIACACAFLVWLGWKIATGSAPEFIERDPFVEEIGEHLGR
jgi:hypothetical protein